MEAWQKGPWVDNLEQGRAPGLRANKLFKVEASLHSTLARNHPPLYFNVATTSITFGPQSYSPPNLGPRYSGISSVLAGLDISCSINPLDCIASEPFAGGVPRTAFSANGFANNPMYVAGEKSTLSGLMHRPLIMTCPWILSCRFSSAIA